MNKTETILELQDEIRRRRAEKPSRRFSGTPKPTLEKEEPVFQWRGFGVLPLSFKLFISLLLCVAGFSYLTLLGSIWSDTEMKMAYIMEGYGSMGNIELIHHSFRYLFWFLGIFAFEGVLFLLTRAPEKIKCFFAVLVPMGILADIGTAWLIRVNPAFAYGLAASGVLLAGSFLVMFLLIQYDLWFRKASKGT